MLDAADTRRSESSPGLFGYALAVTIAFLALVVEIGLLSYLNRDTYWTPLNTALLVLFVGVVPAAVVGTVGATFVHFVTRRCTSQWPAILLAGITGLIVGWVFFSDDLLVAGLLTLDTAGARLAVAPLAHRRGMSTP